MSKQTNKSNDPLTKKIDQIINNVESLKKRIDTYINEKKIKKKWYKKISFIEALGFVIIFGSWISQNIYQNYWQDKKNEFDFKYSVLLKTEQTVFTQEIAAKNFLALNSIAEDTNKIIRANTIRYLSVYCQDFILLKKITYSILNLDKEILSDKDYESYWILLHNDSLIIDRYFQNKNLDSLNHHANMYLSTKMNDKTNSEIDLLSNYEYKITTKLNKFNTVFIISYIIGSILIGIEYIRKQIITQ